MLQSSQSIEVHPDIVLYNLAILILLVLIKLQPHSRVPPLAQPLGPRLQSITRRFAQRRAMGRGSDVALVRLDLLFAPTRRRCQDADARSAERGKVRLETMSLEGGNELA